MVWPTVLLACDQCYVSLLMLLDLGTAFVIIDYSVLYDRLEIGFRVRGNGPLFTKVIFDWWLSGCSCTVNGVNDFSIHSKTGVLQGSALGPLIFRYYLFWFVKMVFVFTVVPKKHSDGRCFNKVRQRYLYVRILNAGYFVTFYHIILTRQEVLVLGPHACKCKLSDSLASLGGKSVWSWAAVKDLGVNIDSSWRLMYTILI